MNINRYNKILSTSPSGLYIEPFFEKVDLESFNLQENWEDIEIPQFLIETEFREYTGQPRKRIDFDNLKSADEEIYYECKYSLIDSALMRSTAYKPITYNEEIADLCELIPFTIKTDYVHYELLSLGGCGMNMAYKLEAYQLLVDCSYDERSNFAGKGITYFETYYGKNSLVVQEIRKMLEIQKAA